MVEWSWCSGPVVVTHADAPLELTTRGTHARPSAAVVDEADHLEPVRLEHRRMRPACLPGRPLIRRPRHPPSACGARSLTRNERSSTPARHDARPHKRAVVAHRPVQRAPVRGITRPPGLGPEAEECGEGEASTAHRGMDARQGPKGSWRPGLDARRSDAEHRDVADDRGRVSRSGAAGVPDPGLRRQKTARGDRSSAAAGDAPRGMRAPTIHCTALRPVARVRDRDSGRRVLSTVVAAFERVLSHDLRDWTARGSTCFSPRTPNG